MIPGEYLIESPGKKFSQEAAEVGLNSASQILLVHHMYGSLHLSDLVAIVAEIRG